MTDDERFEQFLREAAADYQSPPAEAPREDMWTAIRAQRTAAPVITAAPAAPRHVPGRWIWMGMAATLLVGVALGRFAWHRDAAPGVALIQPGPSSSAPGSPESPAASVSPATPPGTEAAIVARTPAMDVRRRHDDGASLPGARSTTYSLVATRHLADVEALLTSYSASRADTRSDTLLARWAKDLLSNTRLLLDSPAARDPVRARLLQDLEVILVQLVQRSPGGAADERSAVERTLDKTQLIPRLRSAVPASLPNGTD
ncbi:MAG: hypothetical protein ACYC3L_06240 [Gemmatimonadaceae bacterium]